MKHLKKAVAFVVIAMFWLYACSKESQKKNDIAENELQENASSFSQQAQAQEDEINKYLNTAAMGLINLAQNANFRNAVVQEVANQFDDDTNVLLSTLKSNYTNFGIVNSANAAIQAHNGNVNQSQVAINFGVFSDMTNIDRAFSEFTINGVKFFPQIYIPFFKTVSTSGVPVILINTGDNEDCIYRGYEIDNDGTVKSLLIDESYAMTHYVWCIGLNESLDQSGNLAANVQKERPESKKTPSVSDREGKEAAQIHSVYVADLKECWTCGKSELRITGFQATTNCSRVTVPGSVDVFASDNFKKLKKNDQYKWIDISAGNPSNTHHVFARPDEVVFPPTIKPSTKVHFIYYEHDVHKDKNQQEFISTFCPSIKLYYFSGNDPYGDYVLPFLSSVTSPTFAVPTALGTIGFFGDNQMKVEYARIE